MNLLRWRCRLVPLCLLPYLLLLIYADKSFFLTFWINRRKLVCILGKRRRDFFCFVSFVFYYYDYCLGVFFSILFTFAVHSSMFWLLSELRGSFQEKKNAELSGQSFMCSATPSAAAQLSLSLFLQFRANSEINNEKERENENQPPTRSFGWSCISRAKCSYSSPKSLYSVCVRFLFNGFFVTKNIHIEYKPARMH